MASQAGTWRRLLAGQMDSAVSSLSGLAAAIYAARNLPPLGMGAYGMFYAMFGLVSQVSTQLIMSPAQAISVEYDPEFRLGILRKSTGLGALIGALPAALVPLGLLQLPGVTPELGVPLAVTASMFALLSPVQDHVRSMFHIANQNWKAVSVASVQAGGVLLGILWLPRFGIAWVPFGAMVIGNALSTLFGMILALGVSIPQLPRFSQFWEIGKSLAITGLAAAGGTYLVATVVVQIAGAETLGLFETARVAARPLQVVGLGLIAVLSPQLMEAAMRRERAGAARVRRFYWLATALLGLVYMGLFAWPWRFNPMVWLVPNTYIVPGLAAAAILGNIAWNLALPVQAELVALRRHQQVAVLELGAQALRSALAFTAALVAAFAVPITLIAGASVKTVVGLRFIGRFYDRQESNPTPEEAGTASI